MSEQMVKSNAPWILGLVGFIVSIPHVICSILCGLLCETGVDFALAGAGDGEGAGGGVGIMGWLPVVCVFGSFILSFFGKSDSSKGTGLLVILLGAVYFLFGVMGLSLFAMGAAVCFVCAGAFSIVNAQRPRA